MTYKCQLMVCVLDLLFTLVTKVRMDWLSLDYSTKAWYIHRANTKCSSSHDLPVSLDGLCPWPTFYALDAKTRNGNSGPLWCFPQQQSLVVTTRQPWTYRYLIHCKFPAGLSVKYLWYSRQRIYLYSLGKTWLSFNWLIVYQVSWPNGLVTAVAS